MAKTFRFRTSTFDTLHARFMKLLSPMVLEKLMIALAGQCTMTDLSDKERAFVHFPHALYATDVTFQQCYRPSGSIQKGKRFYGGKQKLYGHKKKVSVFSNEVMIMFFKSFPRSASDILIMSCKVMFYVDRTKHFDIRKTKKTLANYSRSTQKIGGFVRQRLSGCRRVLSRNTSTPKAKWECLSIKENDFNDRVKPDRVIVENFFGRMCSLWAIMSTKY